MINALDIDMNNNDCWWKIIAVLWLFYTRQIIYQIVEVLWFFIDRSTAFFSKSTWDLILKLEIRKR